VKREVSISETASSARIGPILTTFCILKANSWESSSKASALRDNVFVGCLLVCDLLGFCKRMSKHSF
jgi:hypothetical protein